MVAEGRNLSKDFLGQVDHVHDKARFHKDLIQKNVRFRASRTAVVASRT